jgi:hypothetical protein
MMDNDIDPDSMLLNKDTYIIFYNVPEGAFNEIFSNLKVIY